MSQIKAMIKRNLLIYFRDKGTVFFSVLSALIVLAIMVMFLGESSSSGLLEALNQYGSGMAEDNAKNASWMVQLWILGGILGINSVTVSMTAIGAMVEDEERGRLRSFYVTPASRLNLSYFVRVVQRHGDLPHYTCGRRRLFCIERSSTASCK